MGQLTLTETQEIPCKHNEKILHFESGIALDNAAQRDGEVSCLESFIPTCMCT